MDLLRKVLGLGPSEPTSIEVAITDEVRELAARVRGVDLVGDLVAPGSYCRTPGHYGLLRAGQLVERPDGAIDVCKVDPGQRFPPGLVAGDRWRRFEEAGPFQPA